MKILTVVLGVIVLILLLAFGIFLYMGEEDDMTTAPNNNTDTNFNNGADTPTSTTSPDTDELPTPTDGAASSENITVTNPIEGEAVSSPLIVRGQARTFEQVVNFRLSAADGSVLVEDVTTANAEDIGQFGPYEIALEYPTQPAGGEGTLEVFQTSARDGSEIDKVIIPVTFEGE